MKFYSNGLIFYCKPSVEMHHRVGIIASRKTGNAVIRNQFKRRMRELLPVFLAKLKKPYDCIVIAAHAQITTASFSTLREILNVPFQKISQLQHEPTA